MVCLGLEPGVAGADESTELQRHPILNYSLRSIFFTTDSLPM